MAPAWCPKSQAIETLGAIGTKLMAFLKELNPRIGQRTSEVKPVHIYWSKSVIIITTITIIIIIFNIIIIIIIIIIL